MNHGDFNRDPVESDEFFGELADTIDLVDALTRERLGCGELDRRREEIMNRVRHRRPAGSGADPGIANPAPAPRPATGSFGAGASILDGLTRIVWWEPRWQAVARRSPVPDITADDPLSSRMPSVQASTAAQDDADRYRDSALRKAAAIVKKARQEASDLRAEAQRILDEARQAAAETTAAARAQADGSGGPTAPDPCHHMAPGTSALPAREGPRPRAAQSLECELRPALAQLLADALTAPRLVILQGVPTAGRRCIAASLLGRDVAPEAGWDAAGTGERGDPPVLARCGYDASLSSAWTRLWGPPAQLKHYWHEPMQRAGNGERVLQMLLSAGGGDWDRAADVARRWHTDQVDEGERLAGGRLSRLWWERVATQPCDGAAGWLSALSATLDRADAVAGFTASVSRLSLVRRLLLAGDVEDLTRVDTRLRTRWQRVVRHLIGAAAGADDFDSTRWLAPVLDGLRDFEPRDPAADAEDLAGRLRYLTFERHLDRPSCLADIAAQALQVGSALVMNDGAADAGAVYRDWSGTRQGVAWPLPTRLCPAHRRRALKAARARLTAGEPVPLNTPQLIESGIGVDVPVVLGALAPLDSLLQVAGRVNRDGQDATCQVAIPGPPSGGMSPGHGSSADLSCPPLLRRLLTMI